MFLQAKEATEWEKDLLKSLKVSTKYILPTSCSRTGTFHVLGIFPMKYR